jgi:hypothetical protein
MAKSKYPSRLFIGLIIFVLYLFAAARPVPPETVLVPRWLSSLESEYPVLIGEEAAAAPQPIQSSPIPFKLGSRFGYIETSGKYLIKREGPGGNGGVEINRDFWAAYGNGEDTIEVRDPQNTAAFTIPGNSGYPLFMDGRFFLLGDELNYISALDVSTGPAEQAKILWTYDFAAPLTDIDAASGLILAGFLDGAVEVLDSEGKRIFYYEPGASRLSAIYACRISADGSRLAIISGYDPQRFLLLERSSRGENSGDSWKVVYHEFLQGGFRREVQLAFIDSGRRVAFEREGGLEIYDIHSRRAQRVELEGRIQNLETYGGVVPTKPPVENLLFVITSLSESRKKLVGIRFPGSVVMEAPFRSGSVFLSRGGERLYLGGGSAIAAFELERR